MTAVATVARRVVVVDDNRAVRVLVRTLLASTVEFDVVGEARDGDEAVDVVAGTRPDVVLLDLAMPKKDGLEVIPLLHERAPGTQVVVFTGFGSDRVREAAMSAGADAFVSKEVLDLNLRDVLIDILAGGSPAEDG